MEKPQEQYALRATIPSAAVEVPLQSRLLSIT
jgi:hypothetical protein